jgi:hypothetical protein
MSESRPVRAPVYAGLFLVTLTLMMDEILLTRIFSVTLWYHYAFMAISIAMFGMTVGALIVYLRPRRFTSERAMAHMASSSLSLALTIVISIMTYALLPYGVFEASPGLEIVYYALVYLIIGVPFVFGGICVCVALTSYLDRVGGLYAADLMGAAAGCLLLHPILSVTDGLTAMTVLSLLAGLAALCFARGRDLALLRRAALACVLCFGALAAVQTVYVHRQSPLLRLHWVKGEREAGTVFEKWNSFARIRIWGQPDVPQRPLGWGLSAVFPLAAKYRHLRMNIDGSAQTFLCYDGGGEKDLDFLRYDVTNIAHYIRHDARVLVVGSGGGRDVQSALVFGQASVQAIEINGDILHAANGVFGHFTGHLDRRPNVAFVNDEARSYISRSRETWDILQVSLIDTWAATAAGAFVLTENSIYTLEAWTLFLRHLTPRGVLSFSRWYRMENPYEIYRLVRLASAALEEVGVAEPRDHIVLVRRMGIPEYGGYASGIGTLLVSPEPFSEEDLDILEGVARDMRFEIALSARRAADPMLETLVSGRDVKAVLKKLPLNIAPPTDDAPFFFNMHRFKDLWSLNPRLSGPKMVNASAVFVLAVLSMAVAILTVLCILVPLWLTRRRAPLKGSMPLFVFFLAIGSGFMLVEISQMMRFNILLGHPTYSLSVVLLGLLSAGGLGSRWTQGIGDARLAPQGARRLALLVLVLTVLGSCTPFIVRQFQGSTTPVRILAALGILLPMGLLMGTAFPLGMMAAARRREALTPWLWGLNGAASVCASVLAVVLALSFGISAAYWVGLGCYALAALAFIAALRRKRPDGAGI